MYYAEVQMVVIAFGLRHAAFKIRIQRKKLKKEEV